MLYSKAVSRQLLRRPFPNRGVRSQGPFPCTELSPSTRAGRPGILCCHHGEQTSPTKSEGLRRWLSRRLTTCQHVGDRVRSHASRHASRQGASGSLRAASEGERARAAP